MGAIDLAQKMADALIPPHDADGPAVNRWRFRIAAILGLTIVSQAALYALAFGIINVFGFTGFAQASDLTTVAQQVQAGRIDSLDQQLLELKEKQCDAQSQVPQNTDAARQYGERIYERSQQYYTLTQKYPPIPSCSEL
jgi:hypothetical protein